MEAFECGKEACSAGRVASGALDSDVGHRAVLPLIVGSLGIWPACLVPAQHYFMGGIKVDLSSRTAMPRLYACGEISCSGVHGRNRLASNSLLESLVFAQRAADDILFGEAPEFRGSTPDLGPYREQEPLFAAYRKEILSAMERMRKSHE